MSRSPDSFLILGHSAAKGSPGPKGRNIPAQGKALGHRPTSNPSPEGAVRGWPFVRLADAGIISGGLTKNSKRDSSELQVSYLRVGNVYQNELRLDEIKTIGLTEREFAKTRLEKGDLLIVEGNGSKDQIGRLAIWDGSVEPCVHQNHLIRVRLSERVLPKFAVYWFCSQEGRSRIEHVASSSSGLYTLSVSKIGSLELPLPPLPEQHRIVARIEEIFTGLDAGVAALRHAKTQLQRYRHSVLAAAVTGQLTQAWREQHPDTESAEDLLKWILKQRRDQWNGRRKYNEPIAPAVADLPEIPASWTWSSPAQLSAPEDYSLAIGPFGSNLKVSDYTDEGVPLVFVRHIRANDYNLAQKFVSPEKAAELKAHSIDPGDLLITKMGEPPGDAALYPENLPHAIISADCIKLRLNSLISSKSFFVNAINSQLVAKQIAPITRGVAQKKISLDRFRDIALPLPPLAEQDQIVAEVESRTLAIDRLEAELDRQITGSNRLRQSTLAAAFAGNLL
jgi:type I restriction enzyme S subunit